MAPPKKTLTPADRKAMLAQARGALANRTHPGVVMAAESTSPAPGATSGTQGHPALEASQAPAGPVAVGLAAEPQPADVSRATEHELFQQPRLPEPALYRLAKGWVDNDAADEAYRRVIVDLFEQWEQTAPGDAATRETLYFQASALRAWRAKLVSMARAGDKADQRAERLRILAK